MSDPRGGGVRWWINRFTMDCMDKGKEDSGNERVIVWKSTPLFLNRSSYRKQARSFNIQYLFSQVQYFAA